VPGWDDVRALALALPEVGERTSRGHLEWRVRDRLFVWERPLRRADLAHLGDRAPDAPPLGAWLLDRIGFGELEELVTEAWLARAPRRVARAWLDDAPPAR
jgi:hypothetical protein